MSRAKRWALTSGMLCLVTWIAVTAIALLPAAQGIENALGKWLKALAAAPAIITVIGFWVIGASGGPPDGTWGSNPVSHPTDLI